MLLLMRSLKELRSLEEIEGFQDDRGLKPRVPDHELRMKAQLKTFGDRRKRTL